jgi:hypothetical protein
MKQMMALRDRTNVAFGISCAVFFFSQHECSRLPSLDLDFSDGDPEPAGTGGSGW